MSASRPTEGLYRTLSAGTFEDERVLALSDNGKLMFPYLLHGPHRKNYPAGFAISLDAIVANYGVNQRRGREGLRDIIKSGLAQYDPRNGLWFLPGGLKNEPAIRARNLSTNTLVGWQPRVHELPRCALRTVMIQQTIEHAIAASPHGRSQLSVSEEGGRFWQAIETLRNMAEGGNPRGWGKGVGVGATPRGYPKGVGGGGGVSTEEQKNQSQRQRPLGVPAEPARPEFLDPPPPPEHPRADHETGPRPPLPARGNVKPVVAVGKRKRARTASHRTSQVSPLHHAREVFADAVEAQRRRGVDMRPIAFQAWPLRLDGDTLELGVGSEEARADVDRLELHLLDGLRSVSPALGLRVVIAPRPGLDVLDAGSQDFLAFWNYERRKLGLACEWPEAGDAQQLQALVSEAQRRMGSEAPRALAYFARDFLLDPRIHSRELATLLHDNVRARRLDTACTRVHLENAPATQPRRL